ncbi:hypothetical protein FACS1894200_05580 [Spirochaetia bacterium]|nr:hypothetical protein FACS1894200_05580 [Spirochaetia bacterium]
MKRKCTLALLCLLQAGLLVAQSQTMTVADAIKDFGRFFAAGVPNRSSVAVLSVDTARMGPLDYSALSDYVSKNLIDELARNPVNTLIAQRNIAPQLQSAGIKSTDAVSDSAAQSIARRLSAGVFVTGSFSLTNNTYGLSLQAVSAADLKVYFKRDYTIRQETVFTGLISVAEKKKAEDDRIAAEKKKAEDDRIAAEKKKAEDDRIAAEKKKAEDDRIAAEKKKAEDDRIAAEKKKAEDDRIAAEKKKAEDDRIAAEKKKAEDDRIAAEKKKAEDDRIAAEKKKAEDARIAAEKKKAEDDRIAAEKKAAEDARIAAEKKKLEDERNALAAERKKLEDERLAAEKKKAEDARIAAEKKAEDDRKAAAAAAAAAAATAATAAAARPVAPAPAPAASQGPTGLNAAVGLYVNNTFQSASDLYDALDWITLNAKQNASYTIVVGKDEKVSYIPIAYKVSGVRVTLRGSGGNRKITFDVARPTRALFTVGTGATFVLDEQITLTGLASNSNRLVVVDGGTFILDGGTLSGNKVSEGAAVYVQSGTFTMVKGTISGNTASSNGGGVYVKSGTFTMQDGTITGNTASSGGGVFVDSGTFTMNGGTISSNTASSGGGGVYVGYSAVFIKSGTAGIIYGSNASVDQANKASSDYYGQAVYVSNGGKRNTTARAANPMTTNQSGAAGGWE